MDVICCHTLIYTLPDNTSLDFETPVMQGVANTANSLQCIYTGVQYMIRLDSLISEYSRLPMADILKMAN